MQRFPRRDKERSGIFEGPSNNFSTDKDVRDFESLKEGLKNQNLLLLTTSLLVNTFIIYYKDDDDAI